MPCSFEKPVTRIYKLLSLSLQPLQAKPFFFAATKNRIGRRPCGAAGTGATPAAFYLGLCRLRVILSLPASHDNAAGRQILSWRRLLQEGYSSMQRRKLESDAESAVATTVAGGLFFDAATKNRNGRRPRSRYGRCMRAILYRHNDCAASIRKSGPQESMQPQGQMAGKSCIDSQV